MRALLLDALGTLVALEPPAPLLSAALGISRADAERAIAAEIAYYREHIDEGRDAASVADLRRRCAAVVRDELSRPPHEDLTEVLLSCLRFTAFDDAEPTLAASRAHGIRLVVVSNWDVSLHQVLEEVGIAPLLDAVLTSAETGARKPNPAIFELALELAGVSRQEALHVGDSVREDVAGARAAGIEVVLLARDGRRGPPGVRTIAGLKELLSSSRR